MHRHKPSHVAPPSPDRLAERLVRAALDGGDFNPGGSAAERLVRLGRAEPAVLAWGLATRCRRRGPPRAFASAMEAVDHCLARSGLRFRSALCERQPLDALLHGINSLRFLREGARGGNGRDMAFGYALSLVRDWAELAQHSGEPLGPLVELYVHLREQKDVAFPPRGRQRASVWHVDDEPHGATGSIGASAGPNAAAGGFTSPLAPAPARNPLASEGVPVAVEVAPPSYINRMGSNAGDLAGLMEGLGGLLRDTVPNRASLSRSHSLPTSPTGAAAAVPRFSDPSAPDWPGSPTFGISADNATVSSTAGTSGRAEKQQHLVSDARAQAVLLGEVLDAEFAARRLAADSSGGGFGGGGGSDALIGDLARSCAEVQDALRALAMGGGDSDGGVDEGGVEALFAALEALDAQLGRYQQLVDARQEDHRRLSAAGSASESAAAAAAGTPRRGSVDLCVVCMDHPSSIVLPACGHRVLCAHCHGRLCQSAAAECPVCRAPIHHPESGGHGGHGGSDREAPPQQQQHSPRGAHTVGGPVIDMTAAGWQQRLAAHVRACAPQLDRARSRLTLRAPREGMPLLVLDVDGTLCDASIAPPLARPGLADFLRGVGTYFDLAVWSAVPMDSLVAKLGALSITGESPGFGFVAALSDAAMVSCVPAGEAGAAPRPAKPLEVLWGSEALSACYSRDTTLCVDDAPRNFALNLSNGVRVSTYRAAASAGTADNELFLLQTYLIDLAARKGGGRAESLAAVDKSRWRLQAKWKLRHPS